MENRILGGTRNPVPMPLGKAVSTNNKIFQLSAFIAVSFTFMVSETYNTGFVYTHTENLSFTVKCSMSQCLNLKFHLYITITNFLLCQTSETLLESLLEHCLDTSKIFITNNFGRVNSMSKTFKGSKH